MGGCHSGIECYGALYGDTYWLRLFGSLIGIEVVAWNNRKKKDRKKERKKER